MDAKTNGALPARPVPLNPGETYKSHGNADGLTKREAFAIGLTAAWITALATRHGLPGYTDESAADEATRLGAYSADALLAALSQEPQ